jgi:hypothetical protein
MNKKLEGSSYSLFFYSGNDISKSKNEDLKYSNWIDQQPVTNDQMLSEVYLLNSSASPTLEFRIDNGSE